MAAGTSKALTHGSSERTKELIGADYLPDRWASEWWNAAERATFMQRRGKCATATHRRGKSGWARFRAERASKERNSEQRPSARSRE